jgi:3-hydroxyisobutyrate dehydrogenase-like beta-hydroxyacid dehydrogenase
MSEIMTVAILYPGAMGAAMARCLHQRIPHLKLLTHLSARSEATIKRAKEAGLESVEMNTLIEKSDVIVSILPPSAAKDLASEVTKLYKKRNNPPIYIDANAINPKTVSEIAKSLPDDIPFVDGCVIGGPAREGYDPKIYFSSDSKWEKDMKRAYEVLKDGWKIEVLENAGEGAASGLKMAYGGINKGQTGLAMMMVLGKVLLSC